MPNLELNSQLEAQSRFFRTELAELSIPAAQQATDSKEARAAPCEISPLQGRMSGAIYPDEAVPRHLTKDELLTQKGVHQSPFFKKEFFNLSTESKLMLI